jgi:hypothetical protein
LRRGASDAAWREEASGLERRAREGRGRGRGSERLSPDGLEAVAGARGRLDCAAAAGAGNNAAGDWRGPRDGLARGSDGSRGPNDVTVDMVRSDSAIYIYTHT